MLDSDLDRILRFCRATWPGVNRSADSDLVWRRQLGRYDHHVVQAAVEHLAVTSDRWPALSAVVDRIKADRRGSSDTADLYRNVQHVHVTCPVCLGSEHTDLHPGALAGDCDHYCGRCNTVFAGTAGEYDANRENRDRWDRTYRPLHEARTVAQEANDATKETP